MKKPRAVHLLQSTEWGEFRQTLPSVKKVIKFNSYQIYIHRIPHLPFTIAYLPKVTIPSQTDLETIKDLARKENSIFLKIEPFDSAQGKPINQFTNSPIHYPIGKSIQPQHTIYIDLTQTEEELLAKMHEKTRYNLHLAEKKNVIVKEENTPEALEEFLQLLHLTESRQGFYSHNDNYYRILWKCLSPRKIPHLLSAYLSNTPNTPIASIMLLHYQDFIYYLYGGSDPKYREFMAPTLLHWEAIKLGKELGCKTYDLWGSYKNSPTESDPWWGIYRFKKGFGGEEVNFPDTIDIPLTPLYPVFAFANYLRWQMLHLKRNFR